MADVPLELLGTSGCHLCERAESMVRMAATTCGVDWRYRDIADDDALLERYAERIPVLRHRNVELGWPFGVLDVIRLARGDSD